MNQFALRPSPAVRASLSDDGLVLLDMSGGLVFSSNAAGGRIWRLIEQRRTRADIARRIAEEFEIAADRAQADVDRFVAALLSRGLAAEDAR